MGIASWDDLLAKVTNGGQIFRSDILRPSLSTTGVAGWWYDFGANESYGSLCSPQNLIYGEWLRGVGCCDLACWTVGAGWAMSVGGTAVTHSPGATSSLSQNAGLIPGRTYRTCFTTSNVSGSGSCRIKLGGTAGTNRSTVNTFTENIVAGGSGLIEFEADSGFTVSVWFPVASEISVVEPLAFRAMTDQDTGALWHGGNVSPATKHLLNWSMHGAAATTNPGVWILVDVLGCYPRINMNSAALQTLLAAMTLPRYADGKGVQAFFSNAFPVPGATTANLTLSYTNTVPTSGRSLARTVTLEPGLKTGAIPHSWSVIGPCGPFLPLAAGDRGVKSVESLQLSAATGSGLGTLVLCKPLMVLSVGAQGVSNERDTINQVPALPRIYDGACLSLLYHCGAGLVGNSNMWGHLDFCWG